MKKQSQNDIIDSIGKPQFSTYLSAANGNKAKALDLYLWNAEAASAVMSTTGMVEIQLRNVLDKGLQDWNRKQPMSDPNRNHPYTTNWLKDPAPRLAQVISPSNKPPMWKSALKSMKDINGIQTKTNPSHDDLVAGLTFGSWTSLLPHPSAKVGGSNPRLEIWENGLQQFFKSQSKLHQYQKREVIYYWAHQLRYARNRASHLEPLLNTDQLTYFHRISIRLTLSMNTEMAFWLAGQAYIPKVILKKP